MATRTEGQGTGALPARGVAAHRGGAAERPENTVAAFAHAVASGVHQIELDVRRTRDGALVVMHDEAVDRTTSGTGRVADLRLAELRELDAGSPGERIPTLAEALRVLPHDVWVNVQIQRGEPVAEAVAEEIVAQDRVAHAFVTGGNEACRRVRAVCAELRVCNLVRQRNRADYVEHAIREEAAFVQFHWLRGPMEPELAGRAHAAGLRVNFMCRDEPGEDELFGLFEAGVDFVLVDRFAPAFAAARRRGVRPLDRSGRD